ncbi:hypothetical protein Tco_1354589 [Tanacetum coccineum]
MVLCSSRRSPPYGRPPTNLSKLLIILLIFSLLSIAWIIALAFALSCWLQKVYGKYSILIPLRRSFRAVRTSSRRSFRRSFRVPIIPPLVCDGIYSFPFFIPHQFGNFSTMEYPLVLRKMRFYPSSTSLNFEHIILANRSHSSGVDAAKIISSNQICTSISFTLLSSDEQSRIPMSPFGEVIGYQE